MSPLNLTDEAIEQFKALLARTPNVPAGYGIRIFISGLCHGGPEWGLTTDAFHPETDECCQFGDLKIIVEREVLDAVGGLDVEYENIEDGGGFLIVPLDPEVQALYGRGGCSGDCGHCHGGCCHHSDCGCGCDCDDCDCNDENE